MTTALTKQSAATTSTPRLLSIAANLLPPETIEARYTRKVRRIVLAALAVFTLLMAGWYAVATVQVVGARADLDRAEESVAHVKNQQRQYGELVGTQAEAKTIESQLAKLLANDLQWSQLLAALQQAAVPNRVTITGITGGLATATTGTAGAAPAAAGAAAAGTGTAPPAAAAVTTVGADSVGSVTLSGLAPTKPAIAAYLDALAAVDHVRTPTLLDAGANDDNTFSFTARVEIAKDALGGRFSPGQNAQAGGK